jgi:hypothetical protein
MNQNQESVYRDVTDFVRGAPVTISPAFTAALLREFHRISESRRGYVLVIGPWLVRLTEEDGTWTAQRLPQPPWVAEDPEHTHSVYPITLKDGWDILVCSECGREW